MLALDFKIPWQYPNDPEMQRLSVTTREAAQRAATVHHGTAAHLNTQRSTDEYLVMSKMSSIPQQMVLAAGGLLLSNARVSL